jgi:hypothetical protein
MKPTPQISHNQHSSHRDNRAPRGHRSLPLTDYSFQATAEAQTSSSSGQSATKLPGFHRLSSEFFGAEMSRNYVTEFLLFTLIGGISAWPIMSMLVAVIRLVRNY